MRIAILGFCTHPNNIACAAGGFILKSAYEGEKVVVVSITKGELKSQLTSNSLATSNVLSEMVGSESLHLEECLKENGDANRLKIIHLIRKYQPKIILANAIKNCHPERSKISKLISEASFLSGLSTVTTSDGTMEQLPWRPQVVYHYIQSDFTEPDVVIDISAFFEEKLRRVVTVTPSVRPTDIVETFPADLVQQIENINRHYGSRINVPFAEAFITQRFSGVEDLLLR